MHWLGTSHLQGVRPKGARTMPAASVGVGCALDAPSPFPDARRKSAVADGRVPCASYVRCFDFKFMRRDCGDRLGLGLRLG